MEPLRDSTPQPESWRTHEPQKVGNPAEGQRGMGDGAEMLVGAVLALTNVANGVTLIGTAEAVRCRRRLTAVGSAAEVSCRGFAKARRRPKGTEASTASRRDTCKCVR